MNYFQATWFLPICQN